MYTINIENYKLKRFHRLFVCFERQRIYWRLLFTIKKLYSVSYDSIELTFSMQHFCIKLFKRLNLLHCIYFWLITIRFVAIIFPFYHMCLCAFSSESFRYSDAKIGFLLNPLENMPRVSYNKSYFIIMIMIN